MLWASYSDVYGPMLRRFGDESDVSQVTDLEQAMLIVDGVLGWLPGMNNEPPETYIRYFYRLVHIVESTQTTERRARFQKAAKHRIAERSVFLMAQHAQTQAICHNTVRLTGCDAIEQRLRSLQCLAQL